jgi:hypothetical protein
MTTLQLLFQKLDRVGDQQFLTYLKVNRENILELEKEELVGVATESVTRFEVIDHTSKKRGRIVVEYNVNVELSLQDENRTLKVFLTDKNT